MTTLFVGNVDEELAVQAKLYDDSAVLILADNLSQLHTYSTAYISIGDHTNQDFFTALQLAASIVYVPSSTWEYEDAKIHTELWLKYFSHRKTVDNLPTVSEISVLSLQDFRRGDSPQLWCIGGSVAAGIGVDFSQNFGQLLAKKLQVDVSYLVDQSASIPWCSDQILRSDIRKDDIVVWMLPPLACVNYYDAQIQKSVELNYRTNHRLDVTEITEESIKDTNLLHITITALQRVLNTSRTVGYKLFISTPPVNDSTYELSLLQFLVQQKEFIHCYGTSQTYLDLNFNGDGTEPGPIQHEMYADLFLNALK